MDHREGKGGRKPSQQYRATFAMEECSTIAGRRAVRLTIETTGPCGKTAREKSPNIKVPRLPPTLTAEKKKLLSRVTSRLLNLQAGTPVTYTRKNLGSQRSIVDELLADKLIRVIGGQYVPTFRGIETLEDDIRQLVRENINCVLAALQSLYRASHDQYTFGFEEIVEETKREDPTRDNKDVLPALILGEEFGYHYFENGIQEQAERLAVRSATVQEKIFDFTTVDEGWACTLAQEQADRERTVSRTAKRTDSPAASHAANLPIPDFGFMKNLNLKRIVERDYAELQRVSTVGAPKSRYVLCGGLIEALLLDALLQDAAKAKSSKGSPKLKGGAQAKSLEEWNLVELIDVAVELKIIETDAQQFSHGVRNYRNLIHPGKEAQSNQKVAKEEADICQNVLEIIIRELRAHAKP